MENIFEELDAPGEWFLNAKTHTLYFYPPAGVEIDLARNITIRHCPIYDMPRAGINIGDGCWGGHVIEFRDIFDTVKETGDDGDFP